MKKTIEKALQIEEEGGAVMASEWVTGRGRRISKRAVPACCKEMSVAEALRTAKGKSLVAVKRIVRDHPRCQRVVVVTDRRALNKEARPALEAAAAEKLVAEEKAAEAAKAAEEKAAAIKAAVGKISDPKGLLKKFFAAPSHPCPPEVLAIKQASGLTWGALEKSIAA